MPALLTSTSIDLKRDSAVSTILAAVAGSPMWPSTRATWFEAATSVDWVTFRELATTLKPRSTNPFTIPAPIPCEAPVTMAVFRGLLMVAYPENRERFDAASEFKGCPALRKCLLPRKPFALAPAFRHNEFPPPDTTLVFSCDDLPGVHPRMVRQCPAVPNHLDFQIRLSDETGSSQVLAHALLAL